MAVHECKDKFQNLKLNGLDQTMLCKHIIHNWAKIAFKNNNKNKTSFLCLDILCICCQFTVFVSQQSISIPIFHGKNKGTGMGILVPMVSKYGTTTIKCIDPLSSIDISMEWKDQGWGNRKGKFCFKLFESNGNEVNSLSVFGIAKHQWQAEKELFDETNAKQFFSQTKRGQEIKLYIRVGGGGGHQLYIKDLKVIFWFKQPTTAEICKIMNDK